jgi:MinD-like ATPase involved in chromosome partitioning or flagellar assembly
MSIIERALDKTRKRGSVTSTSEFVASDSRLLHTRSSVPSDLLSTPVASLKGEVDLGPTVLQRFGLLPDSEVAGAIEHQFRRIKRPLVARALDEAQRPTDVASARVIGVTSAGTGEGKTFLSAHLAMSLAAERDLKVILIDADVAKSELTSVFGLRDRLGLLDLIEQDDLQLEDCLYSSTVSGLYVMPSGVWRAHAHELLASTALKVRVAETLARVPGALLLLDTSPILLTNESNLLLSTAGQIIFVVRAGVTLRSNVAEALAAINRNPDIQLVFNWYERANDATYAYGQYGASTAASGRNPSAEG